MTPSLLQVSKIVFTKVNIEPIYSPFDENTSDSNGERSIIDIANFDFEKVMMSIGISTGVADGQGDNPTDYFVELKFAIPNDKGKVCPYKIDIGVAGIIKVSEAFPLEKRDDLVTVNGTSVLMGAVREMVTNITSRSVFGPLTLPTLNFTDHAKKPIKNKKDVGK